MRFFLIDKIIEWEIGTRARAIKNIALSEDFFDDHFPRMPIMPGVLILEGMAQLGGIFLEETVEREMGIEKKAVLSIIDKTKFRDLSRPGDQLIYTAEIRGFSDLGGKTFVHAARDGKEIVATELTFVFQDIADEFLRRDRRRLIELWKEGLDERA